MSLQDSDAPAPARSASAVILNLRSGPFSLDRVRIMGILNTTPDSFYDQGRFRRHDWAQRRAVEMADEGADIIDIGGEKAGPGEPVSQEEELRRVVPAIEVIRREVSVPISVDTLKPQVARAAMEAGAEIINSIGGFIDPELRRVAADTCGAVVVMHLQGQPRVAHPHPHYRDVLSEIEQYLSNQVVDCVRDGIPSDRIMIDPGPGFGKTTEHDLAVLRGLRRFTALPYPVVLAVSRKKFIGEVLDLGVNERLEGSLAVAAWGVLQGVRIVRTHDIRATRRVGVMTEAVLNPALVEAP